MSRKHNNVIIISHLNGGFTEAIRLSGSKQEIINVIPILQKQYGAVLINLIFHV